MSDQNFFNFLLFVGKAKKKKNEKLKRVLKISVKYKEFNICFIIYFYNLLLNIYKKMPGIWKINYVVLYHF